ncbi:MAG: hypothetical protein HYV04_02290 [Deltaproteobacteria bacterium]|nr:hypothetical protein [Deltaproteobacteria bacterium]
MPEFSLNDRFCRWDVEVSGKWFEVTWAGMPAAELGCGAKFFRPLGGIFYFSGEIPFLSETGGHAGAATQAAE